MSELSPDQKGVCDFSLFERLAGTDSSIYTKAGIDVGRRNEERVGFSLHYAILSQIDKVAHERAAIGRV